MSDVKDKNKSKLSIVIKSSIAVVVALLLLGAVMWLVPKPQKETPVSKVKPVPVEVMEILPLKELDDIVIVSGMVEPDKVVDVASEVAGRVASIAGRADKIRRNKEIVPGPKAVGKVEKGDIVKKGQPIIYINTEILSAQAEKAKAELEFRTQEYSRVKQLFAKDVASQAELESIKMQFDMAKASYDLCEAELKRTIIKAPIDSQVNELDVDAGEYVTVGKIIAQFVDMEKAKVVVNVSQRNIVYLKVGQKQKIVAGTIEPKTLEGKITFISDLADEKSHTTRIEITVDNKDGLLRSGNFVEVYLVRRKLKNPVMAPFSAIIPLEDGHVVYVYEDGKAVRRRVVLDYSVLLGQDVRILKGLKHGDQLIIAGNRLIGPGQEVVIETTGKAERLNHIAQKNKEKANAEN